MHRISFAFLLLTALSALCLFAACSDGDNPADPGGNSDTSAPLIVSISPASGYTDVDLDEQILIAFNEDMLASSSDGAISLSEGTITGLVWSDARTLEVTHTAWNEGAAITVTADTGLADAAGNHLVASQSVTFYTMSSEPVFLDSSPADGATDVNRSAVISLLFSSRMELASFAAAVSLTDAGDNPISFNASRGDDCRVIIDPYTDLPADEQITLAVSTAAQDEWGTPLSQAVSISFQTGQDIDDTPPTILSFEPGNGATVGPNTSTFRVTFSEPVITSTTDPVRVNAELSWIIESYDIHPSWSPDGTEFTVPLPTPLPAGLPMEVTFQGYSDLAGNTQPAATTWTAVVEGVADYYPLQDGRRYVYDVYEEGGASGSGTVDWTWDGMEFIQFDAAGGGVFHRADYDRFFTTTEDWDVMEKSGGYLRYLGFHETDEGTPADIVFDDPIDYLSLPPAGTWTSTTTATVPGEGTMTLTGNGRFVSESDLVWMPGGGDGPELFWKNVRLVVIEHTISAGTTTIETGVDSLWLAPTMGIVKFGSTCEDHMESTWDRARGVLALPED